jgi:amino-acid N-acetyltransferase
LPLSATLWRNEYTKLIIRPALRTDLNEVRELLESNSLPSSDCAAHLDNFFVAEDQDTVVGVGGYEDCGEVALIRSFVTRPDHKNMGVAEQIFYSVREKATNLGVKQFYLLTTTASDYFQRLGFTVCSRDRVPNRVRETKQFDELCPSTATVMVLNL